MSLKNEKCPHCGTAGFLFICSLGGVNCAECHQFVRKVNSPREIRIAYNKFKKIQEFIKEEKEAK